jgi:hypothetical protein
VNPLTANLRRTYLPQELNVLLPRVDIAVGARMLVRVSTQAERKLGAMVD